ncbi:hypothetical protein ACFV2Z_03795 [Streptomyces sp. NPDC059688]|uniref:Sortase n=2 Tax=Streptomyces TaxID=1883 RepID=A0ABY6EMR4_9ACTN|nr:MULTISPECIES: hypothetical protein [unclassified Streptomyces]OKJ83439.1 hypothetical protein AMK32_17540 [Streptomyces sp. CB01883]ROP53396.1 hypothetical protein EDD94_2901 [Streptomyces sp. PanSC9]UXY35695.1 hypothetical protein N8I86_13630 [Streptomyces sp. HUAS 14-6]
MRRTARLLTGTALALAAAAPAHAAGTGSLDVYPSTVAPGAQVTVNTAACGDKGSATGDAGAVGAGTFTLAPSTHEGEAIGQFKVPESAQPGTYEIVAKCAEGDRQMKGDLVVALSAAHEQAAGGVQPKGSVKTGVGGALGTDPAQTTAGVAALAVAAAGGTWLLHRRARGDGI